VNPFSTLIASPRLYDAVQRAAGRKELWQKLTPVLTELPTGSLLDVGAGTGAWREVIPAAISYTALDTDELKLARLRSNYPGVDTVRGDATAIPFPDNAFDYTFCTLLSHHLDDRQLSHLFAELARVASRRTVFLDGVVTGRVMSRMLWAIDRGRSPRPADALRRSFAERFDVEHAEEFTVRHSYVLLVGTPRR
jgi:SAM-dependent methyltransferase